ncbi:MAG: hypothetical protein H7325_03110 [Pedobacter sp.]|nr:hypothetical protein [Pedobacter sp.]
MQPKTRKMAMVVNKVKMEDEDKLDVLFWFNQPASERLKTVVSLRKGYFTWLNGSFPKKIAKVVNRRKL